MTARPGPDHRKAGRHTRAAFGARDREQARTEDLRESVDAVELDLSLLTTPLRPYQLLGAEFAVRRRKAVLGDERGLGKTLQALAACAHLAARGGRHFLVVCPAGLQADWIAEARRHTTLQTHSLHGPNREEEGAKWLRDGGLAVAAFGVLHRLECLERDGLYPAMLVVDEAHRITDPEIQRSLAVLDVREHARTTLFLTGTPMEDRLGELRSLVSYLDPECGDALGSDGTAAEASRRAVAPIYLRREQEDVLTELPERIEARHWVRLSDADEERYRAEVRSGDLTGMRRAASAVPGSEKLERLAGLVEAAGDEGRKAVVLSHFPEALEAVRERLGPSAIEPITDRTPPGVRRDLVDKFTHADKPAVLLAQTEAGGPDLDLRAASVVVICEPRWDLSVEEHAIAGTYRTGRERRVQVRRLLAKDSVDERLCELHGDEPLLFEHFDHRSETKQISETAMNARLTRPLLLDDESVPLEDRVIAAERIRLGLA